MNYDSAFLPAHAVLDVTTDAFTYGYYVFGSPGSPDTNHTNIPANTKTKIGPYTSPMQIKFIWTQGHGYYVVEKPPLSPLATDMPIDSADSAKKAK